MATYRVFFWDQDRMIVGRDDFEAADDLHAMLIAQRLSDACSDQCVAFELWHHTRRVDMPYPKQASAKATERTQNIVLERELVLSHSQWVIADSKRLLEETRRLQAEVRDRRI